MEFDFEKILMYMVFAEVLFLMAVGVYIVLYEECVSEISQQICKEKGLSYDFVDNNQLVKCADKNFTEHSFIIDRDLKNTCMTFGSD